MIRTRCSRRVAEASGSRRTRRRPRTPAAPQPGPRRRRAPGRGRRAGCARRPAGPARCGCAAPGPPGGRRPVSGRAVRDRDEWSAAGGRRSPAISPRPRPAPPRRLRCCFFFSRPSSLAGLLLLGGGAFLRRLLLRRLLLRGGLGLGGPRRLLGGDLLWGLDHEDLQLVPADRLRLADDAALGQHQERRVRVRPHAELRGGEGQLARRGMGVQPLLQVGLDVRQLGRLPVQRPRLERLVLQRGVEHQQPDHAQPEDADQHQQEREPGQPRAPGRPPAAVGDGVLGRRRDNARPLPQRTHARAPFRDALGGAQPGRRGPGIGGDLGRGRPLGAPGQQPQLRGQLGRHDRQVPRSAVPGTRREQLLDQPVLQRVVRQHGDPAADGEGGDRARAAPTPGPTARRSPRSAAPGRSAWPGARRCAATSSAPRR